MYLLHLILVRQDKERERVRELVSERLRLWPLLDTLNQWICQMLTNSSIGIVLWWYTNHACRPLVRCKTMLSGGFSLTHHQALFFVFILPYSYSMNFSGSFMNGWLCCCVCQLINRWNFNSYFRLSTLFPRTEPTSYKKISIKLRLLDCLIY